MERLHNLYKKYSGHDVEEMQPISGSGSARRYFRLSGKAGSVIGVIGTDRRENEAFVNLSRAFRSCDCNVPEVYVVSDDGMAYLQQDLGDMSLFSMLSSPEAEEYVEAVMRTLPDMQLASGITEEMLYPVTDMTFCHVMNDLNYFKYCFLKAAGVEADEDALEQDFESLARAVADTPPELMGLSLRDCQSRNVMIHDGSPWFIDFQSARRAPLFYDVASFLWQARAGFSASFRQRMVKTYMEALGRHRCVTEAAMEESLRTMLWIRTLQVLGAYGLRGLTQRKAHFVESIPGALDNVRELLASGAFPAFKELRRCLEAVASMERFRRRADDGRLLVSVFSFSYKQGYPEDLTGNGGGFMFDCRAMHNPGRYERYRHLTGRDVPVMEFLEERGEVQKFLSNVLALTEPAVARYLSRGFSNLQIGFGCTGGQHRSVYCAEHMARMLREIFPEDEVAIHLCHREQNIDLKL